jgi:hypothetical protein
VTMEDVGGYDFAFIEQRVAVLSRIRKICFAAGCAQLVVPLLRAISGRNPELEFVVALDALNKVWESIKSETIDEDWIL